MFDVTARNTYMNVDTWYRDLRRYKKFLFSDFLFYFLYNCVYILKHEILIMWVLDINYTGYARTFRLFCVVTKLMCRVDKSSRSMYRSTGRRVYSTMRCLRRTIAILRNPFCILLEDLLETQNFPLWSHQLLLHQNRTLMTLTLIVCNCWVWS